MIMHSWSFLKIVLVIFITNQVVSSAYCPGNRWTQWFDRDDPSVTGDYETLHDLRKENPGKICEDPYSFEAALTNGRSYTSAGNILTFHKSYGLVCKKELQSNGYCADYMVRFCCPKCKWTGWYDRDNPSATGDHESLASLRKENPGKICAYPVAIDGRAKSGSGYDRITMTPSKGLVCLNKDQSYSKLCKDYEVRFLCC